MKTSTRIIHPGWLRVMHWLNAIAVIVLMTSGWQIYNATSFLGFSIPKAITLGGWLAGRRHPVAFCGHVDFVYQRPFVFRL